MATGTHVAFLGPMGTYSHLVARKRFGAKARMIALPTILDVCAYVAAHRGAQGVVPIENSSGGAIYETVDILLTDTPRIFITQELSLEVRLALLGHRSAAIETLYSHFAPMEHCSAWLRKHLPHAARHTEASTASAAERVAADPHGAALGSRLLAKLYDLDVLTFPVEAEVPNITTFLVIQGTQPPARKGAKTTLAVQLRNEPGSLYRFLGTFATAGVNLSRLISRPIRGLHRQYAFLVDMEGGVHRPAVEHAIDAARRVSDMLRVCGSYPCNKRYTS
jgi:chorismate mutase / prephenate dehydratase